MTRTSLTCLLPALLAVALSAQDQPAELPWSAAEISGFTTTSTAAEVDAFVAALRATPRGAALLEPGEFGASHGGRALRHVRVRHPDAGDDRLRVLLLANIHGGEVCGKEALQMLLRECVAGEHDDWLAQVELMVVPIYNVDGNEAVAATNRDHVNGPVGGLGERANGQELDLNRDFVKVAAPETRALLALLGDFDPHVFVDLHTTNGSPHGFHLTYAPSLSPNADPGIDRYLREDHLPAVRARVRDRHGYAVFDYGNFGRLRWPPDAPESAQQVVDTYQTFDHRPRFATNYVGLRNRLSILSEAYAYEPFEIRVRVTRAFVIENLRRLAADRAQVRELCAAADRACEQGDPAVAFHYATDLIAGTDAEIPVRGWDRVRTADGRTRVHRRSEVEHERRRVRVAFTAARRSGLPATGWAIPAPTPAVLAALEAHGIAHQRLDAPRAVRSLRFEPTAASRARRPFQGVRTVTLQGAWSAATTTLPAGAVIVPSRQRLARVAAQLLEPESEDGLATWGLLDDGTVIGRGDEGGRFPVLRLR